MNSESAVVATARMASDACVDYPVRKSRCIAMLPGAFRPPHIAHYTAVLDLANRTDVDEVIVVVANRCRHVQGTTKVLDVDVAMDVWQVFLQNAPDRVKAKTKVVLAPSSAVKHALKYLGHMQNNDRLLLCLGETDKAQGDTRFDDVKSFSELDGASVEIVTAATASLPVRATALRECLRRGTGSQSQFDKSMPAHLSTIERKRDWEICQNGMRESTEHAQTSAKRVLMQAGFEIQDISVGQPGKPDGVIKMRLAGNKTCFVKYAKNTTKNASWTDPLSLKPRTRLSVERRAIKALSNYRFDNVEVPEIVLFDPQEKLLALSDLGSGGRSLGQDLSNGIFDLQVARNLGEFIAHCHTLPTLVKPLWKTVEGDLNHWRTMLALRTTSVALDSTMKSLAPVLHTLRQRSDAARINGFMHFDLHPKNVFVRRRGIGVIDLERSGSVGDPAYDLGTILGHYVVSAFDKNSGSKGKEAVRSVIDSYSCGAGTNWTAMSGRVTVFAGATVLGCYTERQKAGCRAGHVKHLKVASTLLLMNTVGSFSPKDAICNVIDQCVGFGRGLRLAAV